MPVPPRRAGLTSVATLSGITLTVALLQAAAPDWSRAAGLDVWNYSSYEGDLRQSVAARDRLEAVQEQLDGQIAASAHVVGELIAGRIAFPAALDELEVINRDRLAFDGTMQARYPAATPRERMAHYVRSKIRAQLDGTPVLQDRVLARLEAELREPVAAR